MTTLERQQTRRALLDAGYIRISSTPDNGDGQYTETWGRPEQDNTHITLKWGKKTYDVPTEIENIITAFENAACNAVGYVGAANYAERQTEAEARVAKAALLAKSRLKALFAKAS